MQGPEENSSKSKLGDDRELPEYSVVVLRSSFLSLDIESQRRARGFGRPEWGKRRKNASTRTGKALAVNASHQERIDRLPAAAAERRERAAVFYVLLYLQQQPQKAGGFVNRDLQDDASKQTHQILALFVRTSFFPSSSFSSSSSSSTGRSIKSRTHTQYDISHQLCAACSPLHQSFRRNGFTGALSSTSLRLFWPALSTVSNFQSASLHRKNKMKRKKWGDGAT